MLMGGLMRSERGGTRTRTKAVEGEKRRCNGKTRIRGFLRSAARRRGPMPRHLMYCLRDWSCEFSVSGRLKLRFPDGHLNGALVASLKALTSRYAF